MNNPTPQRRVRTRPKPGASARKSSVSALAGDSTRGGSEPTIRGASRSPSSAAYRNRRRKVPVKTTDVAGGELLGIARVRAEHRAEQVARRFLDPGLDERRETTERGLTEHPRDPPSDDHPAASPGVGMIPKHAEPHGPRRLDRTAPARHRRVLGCQVGEAQGPVVLTRPVVAGRRSKSATTVSQAVMARLRDGPAGWRRRRRTSRRR